MASTTDTAINSTSFSNWISMHAELTKFRLSMLVLLTTLVGYLLASHDLFFHLGHLMLTLLGTAGVAFAANALNEWVEVHRDAKMNRTRNRPLPSGRMGKTYALVFALVSATVGTWILAAFVNGIAATLAIGNLLVYVLIYTPMKPRSTFNTLVGAVCGAIPPMIGWTAVTATLDAGAWILGAILFIWQIPHFLALAWMYREDYERGGFMMLPSVDPNGTLTCSAIILYTLALIPVGLFAVMAGMSGWLYAIGSVIFGTVFLFLGIRLMADKTTVNARKVFFASLLYLPLLLGLMVADKPSENPGNVKVVEHGSVQVAELPGAPVVEIDGIVQ